MSGDELRIKKQHGAYRINPISKERVPTLTNKIGTEPKNLGMFLRRILAGISEKVLARIYAKILFKNLGKNSCQKSWQEFLTRILARIFGQDIVKEFLKGISRTTTKLPRTTIIEQQLYCQEFLVQIFAKILGKNLSWQDLGKNSCQDLVKIFSWQDLGKNLGKILRRILARSWQDLTKILSKIEIGTILASSHGKILLRPKFFVSKSMHLHVSTTLRSWLVANFIICRSVLQLHRTTQLLVYEFLRWEVVMHGRSPTETGSTWFCSTTWNDRSFMTCTLVVRLRISFWQEGSATTNENLLSKCTWVVKISVYSGYPRARPSPVRVSIIFDASCCNQQRLSLLISSLNET